MQSTDMIGSALKRTETATTEALHSQVVLGKARGRIARLVLLTLVGPVAQANSTLLVCDYPADMGRPSAEQAALVPRSLSISVTVPEVQWNGRTVPTRVSESEIRFAWSGYEYTLNRLSGEIRFYSPAGLAAWRETEQRMLRSALARRIPLADAKIMVAEAGRDREFEYREHFGKCRLAGDKMF